MEPWRPWKALRSACYPRSAFCLPCPAMEELGLSCQPGPQLARLRRSLFPAHQPWVSFLVLREYSWLRTRELLRAERGRPGLATHKAVLSLQPPQLSFLLLLLQSPYFLPFFYCPPGGPGHPGSPSAFPAVSVLQAGTKPASSPPVQLYPAPLLAHPFPRVCPAWTLCAWDSFTHSLPLPTSGALGRRNYGLSQIPHPRTLFHHTGGKPTNVST